MRLTRQPLAVAMPAGLGLLAFVAILPVRAQETTRLEKVEVTAQKRVQDIKDVPLAITALAGAALESRGIESAAALAGAVPNLSVAQAPVSSLIATVGMRGISAGQPSIWNDPAVGLYVDGVFVGKNMGALFDVVDIARLEALRGPQGTLFGRNTLAGAMNFVSRKPGGQWAGKASMEIAEHQRRVARLSMDLPKAGMLSASLALRRELQDGTVDNPSTGQAWGGKHRQAGRLALRLTPAQAVTVDYALDRTEINETLPAGVLRSSQGYGSLYPADTAIGRATFASQNPSCLLAVAGVCTQASSGIGTALRQGRYEGEGLPQAVASTASQGANDQRLSLTGHTLSAEWVLSPQSLLRYVAAQRAMRFGDNADYDGTPLHVFSGGRDTDYQTQSHELQWVGRGMAGRYVLGLYYFRETGTTLQKQSGSLLSFVPELPAYRMANFEVGSEAQAGFGQMDWDHGDITLALGGRYTDERKRVHAWRYATDARFVQQGPYTVDLSGDQRFSRFTPSASLLVRLSPERTAFARLAKGFRSGGFPAEAPVTASGSAPNQAYRPEDALVAELGIKGRLAGGRGQFAATAFHMQVRNYQVSLLPAGALTPTVINAGQVRTQGLELDTAMWLPGDARLTLAYGYLEGRYSDYTTLNARGQAVNAASNTVLARAPRHTLGIALDARLADLAGGIALRGLLDLRHVSAQYNYPGQISATADNAAVGNSAQESRLPPLTTLNLKLVLSGFELGDSGSAQWSLFVRNVGNQRRPVSHIDVSGFYQMHYFSEPRSIGTTFSYRW